MKKYFLLGTLLVVSCLGLFLSGQNVFSAEVIADVSVRNIQIISKTDSTIKVRFDLINNGVALSGVKYGARLVQDNNTVDSFIADEELSLALKETKGINLTYNIPVISPGKYQIVFDAKLPSGIVVAYGVGPFIDIAERPSITINSSSCFLTIAGEKSGQHYSLTEGVDVGSNERLILNCEVKNSFPDWVTATPYMAHFLRNRYGETFGGAAHDNYAVSLKAGETKKVQIPVTLPIKAQAYDTSLSFRDGKGFESNVVFAHYVLRGESATIQQITLDKASYKKGESANATISWSGSADSFPGSRVGSGTSFSGLTMEAELSSEKVVCGKVSQALATSSVENISVPVTTSCPSPRLLVSILGKKGEQLATMNYFVPVKKNISVVFEEQGENVSSLPVLFLGLASIILLIVGLVLKKKKQVLVVGLLLVISFGFATVASAATVAWTDKGGNVHNAYVDLDKSAYHSGDSVNMNANFDTWYQWCTNGAKKGIYYAYEVKAPNGLSVNFSRSQSQSTSATVFNVVDSSISGTYTVNVYFGDNLLQAGGYTAGTCVSSGGPDQSCISRCGDTMSRMNGQYDMQGCVNSCPINPPGGTYSCQIPTGYSVKSGASLGSVTLYFTVDVPADPAPEGFLDGASCDYINGWALDKSVPNQSIGVHMYKDGPAGTGSFVGGYTADISRPDVNSVMKVSGNHGYSISTPDSLKDGKSHTIYTYAIGKNTTGTDNNDNAVLIGSPKTISCSSVPKTCTDANANNNGQPLPCTYNCTDNSASNYGNGLPCAYAPTASLSATPATVSVGSSVSLTGSYADKDGNLFKATIRNLGTGSKNGDLGAFSAIGTAGDSISGSSATLSRSFTIPAGTPDGAYWFRTEGSDKTGAYSVAFASVNVKTTPTCAANEGAACTSSANNCGATNSGTIQCNGTCSASKPADNSSKGTACTSAANNCGATNSGTIQCNGTCSASKPADNSSKGTACTSAANNCGTTNSGTTQCDGTCSAVKPADNPSKGASCTSAANNCGDKNTGTTQCNGTCSAVKPADDPKCPPTKCVVNEGTACYSLLNNCGDKNTGTTQCDGTCSVTKPADRAVCCPLGAACTSEPNNCFDRNPGFLQADCSCSGAKPADRGACCQIGGVCTGEPNNCGDTYSGTYQSDCSCNANRPDNRSCGGNTPSTPSTPTDLCPNIIGDQSSVPAGMVQGPTGCYCPEGQSCGGGACEEGTTADAGGVCRPTFNLMCNPTSTELQIVKGFSAISKPAKVDVGAMKDQKLTFSARLWSSDGGYLTDSAVKYLWNGVEAASITLPKSGSTSVFPSPEVAVKITRAISETSQYRLVVGATNEHGVYQECPSPSIELKKSVNGVIIKEY